MKIFMLCLIFVCFAFPVFSQDSNAQRYKSLSDTMNSTVTSSNSKLQSFDEILSDSGHLKTYSAYKEKFDNLSSALRESEFRFNRLVQFNDRIANIRAERNTYANLIKRLEEVKTDYNDWLSSFQ